jgi:putative inorganic carbon (hco3(-)) transporter
MPGNRDSWLFAITLASAAAVLVSIAAAETLLAIAFLSWVVLRPGRIVWPRYVVPLLAFMATTVLSLAMSPQPETGMGVVRKFVLFSMGLLAANFVTTTARARTSLCVLLIVAAVASTLGIIQFVIAYTKFLDTQNLANDPMVLSRITGFMGHWLTFSGEQLLVWCAAIPAMAGLSRRWFIPTGLVGIALILSFTRSVWLGAAAGVIVVAMKLPRSVLIRVLVPVAVVALAASGLIYHRVSMSFQQGQFAPDSGRIALFFGGLGMIHDHPLFGVGPERIHTEFPHYYRGENLKDSGFYYGHLENNVLQIAAERGLLCLAAFLWFIFEMYASLLGMLRTGPAESRWISLSALAALTGFIVAGFFAYNFGDSEILLLFLFIMSMPYGVAAKEPVEEPCPTNLIPTAS